MRKEFGYFQEKTYNTAMSSILRYRSGIVFNGDELVTADVIEDWAQDIEYFDIVELDVYSDGQDVNFEFTMKPLGEMTARNVDGWTDVLLYELLRAHRRLGGMDVDVIFND